MTILFTTRSLGYGGAERQLTILAEGLKSRGYNVIVAVFYSGGQFENRLRRAGVRVENLEKKGRWDTLSFLVRYMALLRRSNPSVIYGFLSLPNILLVLLRKLTPDAKIVWGIRASSLEFERYNWLVRWVDKVEALLAPFADLIIANSYAGRSACESRNFPPSKMIVIPNGIDTEYFFPDRELGLAYRKTHDIGLNDKIVGIVGRLDPMKDHSIFLSAFSQIVETIEGARALIVGSGTQSYRDTLLLQAKNLQIDHLITWVEHSDMLPAVYNSMDVLVSSSRFGEGFPNVVAEAMACETACVVTRVGDSDHVVGDFGEVVEPANAGELSHAVISLFTSGRLNDLGMAARSYIETHFSVDRCVEATEAAICQK